MNVVLLAKEVKPDLNDFKNTIVIYLNLNDHRIYCRQIKLTNLKEIINPGDYIRFNSIFGTFLNSNKENVGSSYPHTTQGLLKYNILNITDIWTLFCGLKQHKIGNVEEILHYFM